MHPRLRRVKQAIGLIPALCCSCLFTPTGDVAQRTMANNPNGPITTTQAPQTGAGGLAFVGRTVAMEPGNPQHVRFSWGGTAVGAHFSGTGLSVTMNDIPATYLGHTGDSYFDVLVDGTLGAPFHLTPTAAPYTVATGLTPGEHTVWLIKRTEGMIGSAELHSAQVQGGMLLAPPPARPHRLEVFGASADVGYGVEATNCTGYQDSQENADKAWPFLVGTQLNADVINLSCSGKGLVNNIDTTQDPTLTMPVIYPWADLNTDGKSLWDFSQWVADAVVLDIGGNDWTGLGTAPDPTVFVPAYVQFIQTIAHNYPKAAIYVVVNATQTGPERDTLRTDMQQVVQSANTAGLTGVRYFEFTEYTGTTFACDQHPSADLYAQMAQEMAAQLHTDLGW